MARSPTLPCILTLTSFAGSRGSAVGRGVDAVAGDEDARAVDRELVDVELDGLLRVVARRGVVVRERVARGAGGVAVGDADGALLVAPALVLPVELDLRREHGAVEGEGLGPPLVPVVRERLDGRPLVRDVREVDGDGLRRGAIAEAAGVLAVLPDPVVVGAGALAFFVLAGLEVGPGLVRARRRVAAGPVVVADGLG